jgi:hypothetical protein
VSTMYRRVMWGGGAVAVAVQVAGVVAITAWMLREIVTGDAMRTQLDSAIGRAYRGGMIRQAQAGVQTAKVRNIRAVKDD